MSVERVARDERQLFTVGHSTRSLEELISLLSGFGIRAVVDLRKIPRSRHNPQFNADTLPSALQARGISYAHLAGLTGLRHQKAGSINSAWRNRGFRGFADHMMTDDFEAALTELCALADREKVAIMCAEAVPWRCHRSLIADALTARGVSVAHITSPGRAEPHRMTPFAKVENRRVTYPG
jgi:uncharacterized protein (DUF488 family)